MQLLAGAVAAVEDPVEGRGEQPRCILIVDVNLCRPRRGPSTFFWSTKYLNMRSSLVKIPHMSIIAGRSSRSRRTGRRPPRRTPTLLADIYVVDAFALLAALADGAGGSPGPSAQGRRWQGRHRLDAGRHRPHRGCAGRRVVCWPGARAHTHQAHQEGGEHQQPHKAMISTSDREGRSRWQWWGGGGEAPAACASK